MHRLVIAGCCTAMLTACAGSPPKPPTVDGSNRKEVNTTETVSVTSLRSELAETKDRVRRLETQSVVIQSPPRSEIFTFHFPFNSARLRLTPTQETAFLPLLANARRIEIRGRTDAERPSAGDERIALRRAQAAMSYLVASGVPASKVSVNYLSGSDYIAENGSAVGRAKNRRVEIEVFNP